MGIKGQWKGRRFIHHRFRRQSEGVQREAQ